MNLNAKVHPGVVALVMALTIIAIGVKMWADGRAIDISGPAQLVRSPTGYIYVQIQNVLLEHDAEGTFTRPIALSEFGVETVIGGIAFLPDGDFLLRRGPDSRGSLDGLRAFARLENTSDIRSENRDAGLARCSLSSRTCVPFGEPGIDFKAAFSVYVDPTDELIYVSDTTRHVLRTFDLRGTPISQARKGFRFPNELLLHEEALLVADTNHHRIALLEEPGAELSGELIGIDVVPPAAEQRGERWPSHFSKVGDYWWVNNMDRNMRSGGIYVFDRDWQFVERVGLPEGADPIAILPFGIGALVSDWDNDRIHYVASTGELLGDLESEGLEAVVAESRERRVFYNAVSWLGIGLFILVIAGIFVKAVLSPREPGMPGNIVGSEDSLVPPDTWVWFQPTAKAVRKMMLGVWAALACLGLSVVMLVVLSFSFAEWLPAIAWSPLIAGLVGFCLLTYWMSRANAYTAIGLKGNQIILRNHRGRESRSALRHVTYSDTTIATRDMAVVLGRPQMPLYDKDEIDSRLLPYLQHAKKVSEAQMQIVLVRLKHPNGIMLILALLLMIAVLTKYLVERAA